MATTAQGLLSPAFVLDTLTQEVHQLLSLAYVRQILEALSESPKGLTARWIDVHIVGDTGSPKSAFVSLNRLAEAGWAASKGPKGSRVWNVTERGRKALGYAREGDTLAKYGGPGHPLDNPRALG